MKKGIETLASPEGRPGLMTTIENHKSWEEVIVPVRPPHTILAD